MNLLRELRRRRVFRVAGIYIVAAWVAIQVVSEALPALDLPAETIRYAWIGAIAGFPLAIIFGWFFDLTADGIRRTPVADGATEADLRLRATDYLILVALAVIGIAIAYRLGSPVTETDERSTIAVLPLDNLSGDPDQAYFAAGMQDALITALSRIGGLQVTSRPSTRAFEGVQASAAEIGSVLGVENLIRGSVRRADGKVGIDVTLVDAEDSRKLWSETYEQDITDVRLLQNEIALAIADQVGVELTEDESRALETYRKVHPSSYEEYLRGMFNLELFTPDGIAQAEQHFRRAVELDPDSAIALWGISRVCRFQLQAGLLPPHEGGLRCGAPLLKAMELNNAVPEVHLGIALGYWLYDYDWPSADRAFRRAIALNPSYAEAHIFYSHFLANQGRFEESTRAADTALALDPLNPFFRGLHGTQRALAGDREGGIARIEASIESFPGLGFGYDVLWWAYADLGRWDESFRAVRDHFKITVGDPAAVDVLEQSYGNGGFEHAMLETARFLAAERETRYVPSFEIAALYDWGGDDEKAIHWLNVAYDERNPTLPYVGVTPFIKNSRDHPEFVALLRKLNYEQWIDK
ncbi:MAG: hypothetical protein R3358_07450 [Woeseiaceae bacterium]|nr:hypothetical protein [Woeseiaceae bacterium]